MSEYLTANIVFGVFMNLFAATGFFASGMAAEEIGRTGKTTALSIYLTATAVQLCGILLIAVKQ